MGEEGQMCLQSQHSERQQTQQNLMLAGWLLGTVLGTGRSGKGSRGLVNEKSAYHHHVNLRPTGDLLADSLTSLPPWSNP